MQYNRETTIGEILSDPTASEVLNEFLPGFSAHPLINHALNMTLDDAALFPGSGVNEQVIESFFDAIQTLQRNTEES